MEKIRKRVILEINKYSPNQLIMVSKLYRDKFSSYLSETAFSKLISRLYISGEIYRDNMMWPSHIYNCREFVYSYIAIKLYI